MSRRLKIILVVVAAVLVVSLIVGGVMVFAAGTTTTTTPSTTTTQNQFITTLASKLGISVDTLTQAIKDTQSELQGQALKDRLQKLVDAGKMTQTQMDDYLKWWNSKPQLPSGILGNGGGFGCGPMMRGGGPVRMFRGGYNFQPPSTTTTATTQTGA